jgi:hypothetical protein
MSSFGEKRIANGEQPLYSICVPATTSTPGGGMK